MRFTLIASIFFRLNSEAKASAILGRLFPSSQILKILFPKLFPSPVG
jgi:hypothetical protein